VGFLALNPAVISALVEALCGGDYVDAVRRRIKWARKGECVWEVELAEWRRLLGGACASKGFALSRLV